MPYDAYSSNFHFYLLRTLILPNLSIHCQKEKSKKQLHNICCTLLDTFLYWRIIFQNQGYLNLNFIFARKVNFYFFWLLLGWRTLQFLCGFCALFAWFWLSWKEWLYVWHRRVCLESQHRAPAGAGLAAAGIPGL